MKYDYFCIVIQHKTKQTKKGILFYFLHFNLIKKAIRKTSSCLQQFVQHFGGSVIKPCAKEMLVVSNAILANEENAEVSVCSTHLEYIDSIFVLFVYLKKHL